jgi:hypothetical protein
MRGFTVVSVAAATAALMACAKAENTPADTSAAAAPPPPPSMTVADFAGTWAIKATNQAGDSVLVTYDLMATPDGTGWTVNFANRPPVPARVVTVGGDSIVVEAGPYESVLQKGVQVSTHTVLHLENGMLKGMTTARYTGVKTADSVRMLPQEGTKKP